MLVKDLIPLLDAELIYGSDDIDIREIHSGCGSDMMSDVLAFVKDQPVLLTGLCNPQVIRTAEMMDIMCLVFVRGKRPDEKMIELARERGIWLVGGTLPELAEDRVYNTCYVFAPDGQLAAKHRKMHLFDIDVAGGQRFMESETLTAGNSVTTFETPWGVVGVCVCFDFRFTELSELMVLAGAKLVVVPAAFNLTTGPAHWELLFRQRAVDGQCYTVGTSPARDTAAGYVAWGHSIVCDPWGTVVRQCDETPQTVVTTLDLERVEAVRQQLPILSARRTDVYELRRK